ncbi:MAG: hypothetical protein GXP15_07305 [Gammaproteobacteria bacterium]|nr:hypothetical protein [Gammaproteobacteria bacterium]
MEIISRLGQPWMVPYIPGDDAEAKALVAFRQDIYPRDVIAVLSGGGVGVPVRWTGIVVERRTIPMLGGNAAELIVEHHYWDWRETTNDELIYISPRGEGRFRCFFPPYEVEVLGGHQVGDFVIVYGIPWMIRQTDGLIGVECLKTRFIPAFFYTTEAWSYGRDFVEKGDIGDVRILSTK